MEIRQPDLYAAIAELQIWRSFLILRYTSFLYRRTLSKKLVMFIGKTYTTTYDRDQTVFSGKCCKIEWQNCPPSKERRHFLSYQLCLVTTPCFSPFRVFPSISFPPAFLIMTDGGKQKHGRSANDFRKKTSATAVRMGEYSTVKPLCATTSRKLPPIQNTKIFPPQHLYLEPPENDHPS